MTDDTLHRLARLLVLRQIDLLNATRPIDIKTTSARLEGAADAVHRIVNAWGPEQIHRAIRETVPTGRTSSPGGYTVWFDERANILTEKLALIQRDEEGS